jgi:hypothetical protein
MRVAIYLRLDAARAQAGLGSQLRAAATRKRADKRHHVIGSMWTWLDVRSARQPDWAAGCARLANALASSIA